MDISNDLKSLFLDDCHADRPISYFEFKAAGLSDENYIIYCNLCEAVRGTCILYWNNGFKNASYYLSIIDSALCDLTKWLEKSLNSTFDLKLNAHELTMKNVLHYHWDLASDESDRLLSLIYTSSEDFRCWLEVFIKRRLILGKKPNIIMSPERDRKPSKKEKRESCEFYTHSTCILDDSKCDKDYCSSYEKGTGFPIKHIPTNENEVDFGDTVCVSTVDDGKDELSVTISHYFEQLNMKPIEKALVHRRVGDIIVAGVTKYSIKSIKKAPRSINKKSKSVCLLSEWQKAARKLDEIVNEHDDITIPDRPADLGNTSLLYEWAKTAGALYDKMEDLQEKIWEYEQWLESDD